ncbi:glutathione S-transferase family protein [Nostoc sp. FACHB-892]|uniref:glutathione S-transferase family protein n=1 Tax=Nostoc sp. FACHB-892 TaxID=2692843 RepID=UPI0016841AA3|nr:glutathione S-transferase family protein [Nostoc sp. FACHB-892]MBD2731596.1 glutathione S-transferase family protein [Nostoc sp. FACHB-892]
MSLELYHFPDSLCSQKVRIALAEKELEWKSHIVNLLTFENLQPNYIRINPKGVVPTLVDNGKVICNSAIILNYLDQNFPEISLTPTDPALQEKMNQWISLQDSFPMRELIYGNLKGIDGFVARRSVRMKQNIITKLMREYPDLNNQYATKLKDVKDWNITVLDKAKIGIINEKMNPILDKIENEVSKSMWLCGDEYSLADVVWTAVLNYLVQLQIDDLAIDKNRKALSLYIERLKSRPSFKIAIKDYLEAKVMQPIILAGLKRIFLGF